MQNQLFDYLLGLNQDKLQRNETQYTLTAASKLFQLCLVENYHCSLMIVYNQADHDKILLHQIAITENMVSKERSL